MDDVPKECYLVAAGVLILVVLVAVCRESPRRARFQPDLGGYSPPYFALTNYPNPRFANLTVPLSPALEATIADSAVQPQSDCVLSPGGQCRLAVGGLGTCDPTGRPVCVGKQKKKL